MKRLINDMGENSPQEYDRIYHLRKEEGDDDFDIKRWKKLLKHYRGGRLVDLGCLDSKVFAIAKQWYPDAEVWGIDVAEEAIKDMANRFVIPNVFFQVGDVYNTGFPPNYFAYATAGELIEHLDDPEKFVKEAIRVLKRGGVLALSTPFAEAEEVGAVDHERHLWSFDMDDIERLLKPYGEVWIRTMGSQYFPYRYHWPNIIGYVRKI